jgi:hypothetical protein
VRRFLGHLGTTGLWQHLQTKYSVFFFGRCLVATRNRLVPQNSRLDQSALLFSKRYTELIHFCSRCTSTNMDTSVLLRTSVGFTFRTWTL